MRRATLALALALTGCGSAPPTAAEDAKAADLAGGDAPDTGAVDAGDDPGPELPAQPLTAVAVAPRYALVGEPVLLDGSASTGATAFQWSFGNGDGWDAPRPEPTATVTYAAPGRHQAVLSVFDAVGARRTATALVTVTHAPTHVPRQSSTLVRLPGEPDRFAVVSADSSELVLATRTGDAAFEVTWRASTAAHPRTVAHHDGHLLVACQDAGTLQAFRAADGELAFTTPLPAASRPFGVVAIGDAVYVSLQATGELARLSWDPAAGPALLNVVPALPDARALALLPDGRVAVARWRSPDTEGQIAVIDPDTGAVAPWTLELDPQEPSDTESGGVPSYLSQILVPPTGGAVAIPSLQANLFGGLHLSGQALAHDTTVRAVLSWLDPASGVAAATDRKHFDNRGFASAGVFTSRGDYLFVADRGARAVERLDALTGAQSGTLLDVGYAPEGLALTADDRFLLVDATLSRELVVFDVSDFTKLPTPVARLTIPSAEPLAPAVLRGKQLFGDAFDPRLGRDGYMACAHCHLEGDSDRRVWDFTDRGEGLRNTIGLLGRAGLGHGPLHWSANFDEVQDFENDIRGPFEGHGLIPDADLPEAAVHPLGAPKAGLSADLDALAAYVTSLAELPPSPHRLADGGLSQAAHRGRALFESPDLGCATCHAGAALTDSAWEADGAPRLHDVGTLTPASGQRLGGPLPGLDTPTLHGLWDSAPYLHDGSAPTLEAVLTIRNPADQHGTTSQLTAAQIADLVAFLLSLDGRPLPEPP